jgi:hypothetical protein
VVDAIGDISGGVRRHTPDTTPTTEGTQQVRVVRAGDTVWCPPGERHWHGAAPDSFMAHTAISLGTTSWEGPVDDSVYRSDAADDLSADPA